ncbi:hypothetical protein [Devosia sp. A449]
MMNVINIGFWADSGKTVADETLGQRRSALPHNVAARAAACLVVDSAWKNVSGRSVDFFMTSIILAIIDDEHHE